MWRIVGAGGGQEQGRVTIPPRVEGEPRGRWVSPAGKGGDEQGPEGVRYTPVDNQGPVAGDHIEEAWDIIAGPRKGNY